MRTNKKGGYMFTDEEKKYLLKSVESDLSFLRDVIVSEPEKWKAQLELALSIEQKLKRD